MTKIKCMCGLQAMLLKAVSAHILVLWAVGGAVGVAISGPSAHQKSSVAHQHCANPQRSSHSCNLSVFIQLYMLDSRRFFVATTVALHMIECIAMHACHANAAHEPALACNMKATAAYVQWYFERCCIWYSWSRGHVLGCKDGRNAGGAVQLQVFPIPAIYVHHASDARTSASSGCWAHLL